MDWLTALSIVASAAVGFTVLYFQNRAKLQLAVRQDRLIRVSQQLRYLYGPLYTKLQLEQDLFQAFKNEHSIGTGFWQNAGDNPTKEQGEAWREWMKKRFMPINESMLNLVIDRTDLLEDSELPECFRLLQRHVVGYEILATRWAQEDYSQHLPDQLFPRQELHSYAEQNFERLKQVQSDLLRKT